QARCHCREPDGSVGHAVRLFCAGGARHERVGLSQSARARMRRRGLPSFDARVRSIAVALLLAVVPSVVRAQTHLLIVSGLGGEPKYVESFRKLGLSLVDAAK